MKCAACDQGYVERDVSKGDRTYAVQTACAECDGTGVVESLHEVLARLGYTTADLAHGRKRIQRAGFFFDGTAGECWEWLRASGQVT